MSRRMLVKVAVAVVALLGAFVAFRQAAHKAQAAALEKLAFEKAEKRRKVQSGELVLTDAAEIANMFGGFIPAHLRTPEIRAEMEVPCTFDPASEAADVPPSAPCRHWDGENHRVDCDIDRQAVSWEPGLVGTMGERKDCTRATFGHKDSIWPKRHVGPRVPADRFPKTTVVTALIDIGRHNRPRCRYLELMLPLLRVNSSIVMHIEPWAFEFVTAARAHYGLTAQTAVRVVRSWEEVPFSKLLPRMREAVDEHYFKHAAGGWQNGVLDHSYAEYDWINHAKVGFVKRAALENPFGSDYFFWLDAGYGRYQTFTQQICPCLATDPDKVTLFTHSPPASEEFVNGEWKVRVAHRHPKHSVQMYFSGSWITGPHYGTMHGGFWGGGKAGVLRYHDVYEKMMSLMLLAGIVDDDQPVQELTQDLVTDLFQVLGFDAKACMLEGLPREYT
eukprot:COSAG04_NODE_4503_length_2048_cov_2.282709_1_plen_446_part_00